MSYRLRATIKTTAGISLVDVDLNKFLYLRECYEQAFSLFTEEFTEKLSPENTSLIQQVQVKENTEKRRRL